MITGATVLIIETAAGMAICSHCGLFALWLVLDPPIARADARGPHGADRPKADGDPCGCCEAAFAEPVA